MSKESRDEADWHGRTRRGYMILVCSALIVVPAVTFGSDIGEKIVLRAAPARVEFSDRSTTWNSPTTFVGTIEPGVVVITSRYMALDTDGAPRQIRACDPSSSPNTSLRDPSGKAIDANAISYFVLPGCEDATDRKRCEQNPPYKQLGVWLGNVAAVLVRDKVAFAIAADFGPEKQFGEGSIELHRQLGHETVGKHPTNLACAKDESLEAMTTFVIFLDAKAKWLSKTDIEKEASSRWRELLRKLDQ